MKFAILALFLPACSLFPPKPCSDMDRPRIDEIRAYESIDILVIPIPFEEI
jgi:hypothetical protein